MNRKKPILIIGAGRLGTSLFTALSEAGAGEPVLAGNKPLPRSFHANLNKNQYYSGLNENLISASEIIFLCVKDSRIAGLTEILAGYDLSGKAVFHTSGFRTSEDLSDLARRGTISGSFHPLQSFPQLFSGAERWKAIICTYEGHPGGLPLLEPICRGLRARLITVNRRQKQALHLSAAILTNFGVGLINWAESVITEEFTDRDRKELLLPMLAGLASNYGETDIHDMLTGPLQRGDTDVLRGHIDLLPETGRRLYLDFAGILLEDDRFHINDRHKVKDFLNAYKI